MSEGGLHQVDRSVAIERVAGVGVAHPVRRDFLLEPGFPGRGVYDAADLRDIERSPALPAAEDRVGRFGLAFDGEEMLPYSRLQQHRPRLAPLAEHGNLSAVLARERIAPLQTAQFAYADA